MRRPSAEARQGRYWLDRESVLGPVLLLPAVIYIIALVGIPLVLAVLYSLSDVTVGDQSIDFVGLKNFRDVARQLHLPHGAAKHLCVHHRLAGGRAGAGQYPGPGALGRLPRQAAGPLPGAAALDDADRARRAGLAVDARQRLQPDRLRDAAGRAAGGRQSAGTRLVRHQQPLARLSRPGPALRPDRPRLADAAAGDRDPAGGADGDSRRTSRTRRTSTAPDSSASCSPSAFRCCCRSWRWRCSTASSSPSPT